MCTGAAGTVAAAAGITSPEKMVGPTAAGSSPAAISSNSLRAQASTPHDSTGSAGERGESSASEPRPNADMMPSTSPPTLDELAAGAAGSSGVMTGTASAAVDDGSDRTTLVMAAAGIGTATPTAGPAIGASATTGGASRMTEASRPAGATAAASGRSGSGDGSSRRLSCCRAIGFRSAAVGRSGR